MNSEAPAMNLKPNDGKLYLWKPEDRENEQQKKISKASGVTQERGGWGNKLDFLFSCISVSVGLGNVWRFPYLCYKHGGGAFVITYMIAMIFGGIPLFYQEVALGQYLGAGGMNLVGDLCPILKGSGYATMTIVFFLDVYYCVIIAWTLFYLFSSFSELPDLPWEKTGHWWNSDYNPNATSATVPQNATFLTTVDGQNLTAVEEFWEVEKLEMARHGQALQDFTADLLLSLENLKAKRDELQAEIELEEVEKARLQGELGDLSVRLAAVMSSLTQRTSARANYDRAIAESETALCRLLENSQTIALNVRRELSYLMGAQAFSMHVPSQSGHEEVAEEERSSPSTPCPTPSPGMNVCCRPANGL